MARPVTIGEFATHLEQMAHGGFRRLVLEAADHLAEELEDEARANVKARLNWRSRQLLTSVRSAIEESPEAIRVLGLAGGEHQGIRIRYARIHEEGGVVRPKNGKALAIPVGPALTGTPGHEQPRYPSARQAPHLIWAPGLDTGGNSAGLLIHRHTGEIWYVLIRSATIPAQHYMRDAVLAVHERVPAAFEGIFDKVLQPGAQP